MPQYHGQRRSAPALSNVVRAGSWIFISGQVPTIADLESESMHGIESQTGAVLEKIRDLLLAAGSDLTHVVKTTVYLTDISDFDGMNAVYRSYFPDNLPARTTVGARLAVDALIEIDAIALVP